MTAKEHADRLWPEIEKRGTHWYLGSEGAVKRLLARAIAAAVREAKATKPKGRKKT